MRVYYACRIWEPGKSYGSWTERQKRYAIRELRKLLQIKVRGEDKIRFRRAAVRARPRNEVGYAKNWRKWPLVWQGSSRDLKGRFG